MEPLGILWTTCQKLLMVRFRARLLNVGSSVESAGEKKKGAQVAVAVAVRAALLRLSSPEMDPFIRLAHPVSRRESYLIRTYVPGHPGPRANLPLPQQQSTVFERSGVELAQRRHGVLVGRP